jgi:chemotaxis response regulator CheB
MKTQVAQRVVVMGLEGSSRDQLVSALSEFGVTPVWVGKPLQSNPEELLELNPNRVIVSLEPSIEQDLEAYSDFLSRPTVTVLYDDAETTRALSGWDLNRWARHMASKLLNKELLPQSATVTESSNENDLLEDHSIQWDTKVDELETEAQATPTTAMQHTDISVDTESHISWNDTGHYDTLEINPDELNAALEHLNASLSNASQSEHLLDTTPAGNALLEIPIDDSSSLQLLPFDDELQDVRDGINANSKTINAFSSNEFSLDFDTDFGHDTSNQSAEGLESQSKTDSDAILLELTNQVAEIPHFDLSKYALLDAELDTESSEAGLDSLENAKNERKLKQLLLVISGLGGPSAMRMLLSEIKPSFNGVIVISHDIDSMQLPKLRDQLQKISKIPMLTLETDEFLKNGNIYVLNKQQTIQSTSLGYQCIAGISLSGYILQMDPNVDIVILSGADPLLSQALIQVSSLLSNIHVQAPDDCFEPTLAQHLVNIGAPLVNHEILEQWFN